MTVMVGIGGILAEVIRDVSFGSPRSPKSTAEMLDDLATQRLFGEFREPEADRAAIVEALVARPRRRRRAGPARPTSTP